MSEAGERTGFMEKATGTAKGLAERLRNRFSPDNAQQPRNPANIAAAEAALDMDIAEAAARLRVSFPDKYPTQAAAEKAVADMGAAINQDRRADNTRTREMNKIEDIMNQMPGAGQSPDVDNIIAEMEQRAQAQRGQKP